MKFERKINGKNIFLYGLICVVTLTIIIGVKGSRAGYRSTASIELTSGTVVSSPYDFKILSLYIDGVKQSKDTLIPTSGYIIDEENSYCCKTTPCNKENRDSNVRLYTDELEKHVYDGTSEGSKCNLAFTKIDKTINDKCGVACQYILDKVDSINIRRREYKTFNVPFSDTNNYIYAAEDNNGTSYYFAGNPTNNWVLFGGYYWRIIRTNGDGSIRMIYQGTSANTTGMGTQINGSTYAFNSAYDDNAYVGYFYTKGQLRGLGTASNAYTVLNNWFENSNIKQGTSYFNFIDSDAGFCGDRTPSTVNSSSTTSPFNTGNGSGGIGTTITYYGAYLRLSPQDEVVTSSTTKVTPTLICGDKDDLYTYKNSTKANNGNKVLENPVGMITADEVSFAGMVFATGSSGNYLDTDQSYWTMSPYNFNSSSVRVFGVYSGGWLGWYWVASMELGIRPVINLRSDVQFTGDGTQSNPYKVVS